MEEELVDDLVVFARGIHTSVTFTKKGPCKYEIRNRCVKLQARHGVGALPELIVIDGPLQQPLNDYVSETGENEMWSMPVLGTQEPELRAIPRAARVSFPKLDLPDRIEAMEIAVSEVHARKQHAQQLAAATTAAAAASAMPPRPKASGQSPMRRAASPLAPLRFPTRSFSQEHFSSTDVRCNSSRSVTPLRSVAPPQLAVNRTQSDIGINRTCSTDSLTGQTVAHMPVPRFQVSSPLSRSQSPSPLRMISSPVGSDRSLTPMRAISPTAAGLRQGRGAMGVPQNRYAFVQDMNASLMSNSPPAHDVDAALRGKGKAVLETTAPKAFAPLRTTSDPPDGSHASSDSTTPPDNSASFDSTATDSSTCSSQLAGTSEPLQAVGESVFLPRPDASQGVGVADSQAMDHSLVAVTSSPMQPAGRTIKASEDTQCQFLARPPPPCLFQVMPGTAHRLQSIDMPIPYAGNAQTRVPSQHDCSYVQTPTPVAACSNRPASNSYQPPCMEQMFCASLMPPQRSMTPQRLPPAPPELPRTQATHAAAQLLTTTTLTSVLGGFGTPSSPRHMEGGTQGANPLPCTDTFLVVPPPPAPGDTAMHGSDVKPPLSAPAPVQQRLGVPPSRPLASGHASPVVRRRFCSRGRSPGPARSQTPANPVVVRRCSRGVSPVPLPTVAFGAVAA